MTYKRCRAIHIIRNDIILVLGLRNMHCNGIFETPFCTCYGKKFTFACTVVIWYTVHILNFQEKNTICKLSLCVSIYLSVCKSFCLSICLYICLSVCLSGWESVFPSSHLSVCLSICFSVCLSVHMCVHACLCIYLYMCMYVWIPVCIYMFIYVHLCICIYYIHVCMYNRILVRKYVIWD